MRIISTRSSSSSSSTSPVAAAIPASLDFQIKSHKLRDILDSNVGSSDGNASTFQATYGIEDEFQSSKKD